MSEIQKDKILALIPARGGSKGIPGKNIKNLGGKPLIAYSIEHASKSKSVGRVIVTTDDPDIGKVAERYGAEIIWRPKEISGDTASSESALLHALRSLQDKEGYEPDWVVFLQATSPLRQPEDIEKAIETIRREAADSLFSACPAQGFLWRKDGAGLHSFSYDFRQRPRRQEGPEDYVENGSIYVFKPWVLRKYGNRLGGKITVYPMSYSDSLQVDTPMDLSLMDQLLRLRRSLPQSSNGEAIKLLALDFDGIFTDNRVLVDQKGEEAVWCNRADGWGIARLKEAGVRVIVLSAEKNPVVGARCRKLDIECFQGYGDKLRTLKSYIEGHSLDPREVAYVGNDVNDRACMEWVGMAIAPADAHPEVLGLSCWITRSPGGGGVVREVADWILASRMEGPRAQ